MPTAQWAQLKIGRFLSFGPGRKSAMMGWNLKKQHIYKTVVKISIFYSFIKEMYFNVSKEMQNDLHL